VPPNRKLVPSSYAPLFIRSVNGVPSIGHVIRLMSERRRSDKAQALGLRMAAAWRIGPLVAGRTGHNADDVVTSQLYSWLKPTFACTFMTKTPPNRNRHGSLRTSFFADRAFP
jgi:hypothetical protein